MESLHIVPLPSFQRIPLRDGGLLILRIQVIEELGKDEAERWKDAAKRFGADRAKYTSQDIDSSAQLHAVAGVILHFATKEFHHAETVKWAAFVEIDVDERGVSNTLNSLGKIDPPPIEPSSPKGPGAKWKVNPEALKSYLA